jgi:hypothetical protein
VGQSCLSFLREVFGTLLFFGHVSYVVLFCLYCILFKYNFYLEQGVILIGAANSNSFAHDSEPVGVTVLALRAGYSG